MRSVRSVGNLLRSGSGVSGNGNGGSRRGSGAGSGVSGNGGSRLGSGAWSGGVSPALSPTLTPRDATVAEDGEEHAAAAVAEAGEEGAAVAEGEQPAGGG